MGLLQKVTECDLNKKSNYVGLLKKSLMLSLNHKLDFFEFAQKYKIPIFASFKKHNDKFLISECFGFDGISILSSISTSDFWKGTIKSQNKWYEFSTKNNNLLSFYQFFSFEQKDKINFVYINVLDNETILMICDKVENECIFCKDIIEDYKNIQNQQKINLSEFNRNKDDVINKYSINFESVIKDFIANNLKNIEYNEYFTDVLSKEVFYTLKQLFAFPDYIAQKNPFEYNILLFSKQKLPDELFKAQLKSSFKSIFNEYIDLIEIEDKESVLSYLEVQEFLQEK